MINICRFFKHKCFEKEYREAVEECEALKLENKELYRILADLKEERKLKDKYKQECEQKHEIIEELIRERQELQKQLRHQLDMNIAMNKECEDMKFKINDLRQLRELDREARERMHTQLEYKSTQYSNVEAEYTNLKNNFESLIKQNKNYVESVYKDRVYNYDRSLEDIEKVINNILNSCLGRNTVGCTPAHNVCGDLIKMLNIVSKAKEYKSD